MSKARATVADGLVFTFTSTAGDATTDAATVAASRSVILAVPFLTPVNVHSAAFAAET